MKYNKNLLIILFIQISVFSLKSQEIEKTYNKNIINFTISNLLFNQAIVEYERTLTNKSSIKLIFGIDYPTSKDIYDSYKLFLLSIQKEYKVSNGFQIGIGYKYIISQRNINRLNSDYYIETELYYHSIEFTDKYYQNCAPPDKVPYLKKISMDKHQYGAKILFGKRYIVELNKIDLNFNLYTGIGLRYNNGSKTLIEERSGTCDINETNFQTILYNDKHIIQELKPTFHMGLKIGVSF